MSKRLTKVENSTVVSAAYDCSGAGGRKLVRLDNGWLCCAVINGTIDWRVYVSKNDGKSWSHAVTWLTAITINIALASYKNTLYLFCTGSANAYFCKVDLRTVSWPWSVTGVVNPDIGQTAIGIGCSITADKNGVLHAAWCSKNSTYPDAFNIKYNKSINGGASWIGATQVTGCGTGCDLQRPCIVLRKDNNPIIFADYAQSNYKAIIYAYYTGLVWEATSHFVYGYSGNTYEQDSPCAITDKNGAIHVVWHGKDSVNTGVLNVRYSKSVDNGANWSPAIKLTSGNSYHQAFPTISVDKYNRLCVLWYGAIATYPSIWQIRKLIFNGVWGGITE